MSEQLKPSEKKKLAIGFEKDSSGYWTAVLYEIASGRAKVLQRSEPALKTIAFDDFRSWAVSKVYAASTKD